MTDTTHHVGQIAEYGTPEHDNHRSIRTVLENATFVNPHGIQFRAEFYHKTEGYTPAGSCATWTKEVWGYRIYWNDGTSTGKFWSDEAVAQAYWESMSLINRQPVTA